MQYLSRPASALVLCHFESNTVSIVPAVFGSAEKISGIVGGQASFWKTSITAEVKAMSGDFNNDGKMDLVVTDPGDVIFSDLVSVLLGNGDGTFQSHVDYHTDTSPETLNIGDLNRDGNPDLVVGTRSGIVFLLGNGDGTFQRFVEYPKPQVYAVALADFNGDAILDLAVGTVNSEAWLSCMGMVMGLFRMPSMSR